MKKDPKSFASGDLVFAKVRGYPAWPARVTCPADKNCTKFHVFFYGTYETAICKTEELWIYDAASKAKYGRQKRKFFAEALDEIENRPDIAIAAPGNIFSHWNYVYLGWNVMKTKLYQDPSDLSLFLFLLVVLSKLFVMLL